MNFGEGVLHPTLFRKERERRWGTLSFLLGQERRTDARPTQSGFRKRKQQIPRCTRNDKA